MGILNERLHLFRDAFIKHRVWLRGTYLEYLIVLLIFISLTIVYTNFIALHITTQIFAVYPGDGSGGFLWYNFVEPGLSPLLAPTNMVNYPYGEAIGGPTFITYLGLWMPMRILAYIFGPIAGANLFMLLGYILSAMSMYWLVKRLTGNMAVAFFAAFAASYAPYTIAKSFDQVPYILSYVFIFIIAGFIGFWKRPTVLRSLLLALAIALAFYTDGYYLLLATVLVLCLCGAGLLYSVLMKVGWEFFWQRVTMLLIAPLCLLVLMSPVLYLQFSHGSEIKQSLEGRRSDIAAEFQLYRAHIADFILPSYNNPFLANNKDFAITQVYKNQRSNPGESTNYIGYVIVLLMAIGGVMALVWLIARRYSSLNNIADVQAQNFILIASIAAVSVPVMLSFMFSPFVYILGHKILLPGQFLIDHNISLWRVPSRFFVPLHVIAVLFAAISLWIALISARFYVRRGYIRHTLTGLIVFALTIILACEYATTFNRPSYDFSKVAKGYSWLRQQPNIDVVGELPLVDPLDHNTADYVTNQVVHTKKIINSKESSNTSLTNVLGGIENPETIDWAYQRGAKALITHNQPCIDVAWGKVIFKDDKDPKNSMCIYSLERPITSDKEFVKFNKGFLHRPNATNQEVTVFSAINASLDVTDDRFTALNHGENIRLTANLGGHTGEENQGRWSIVQNGKIVSSGDIFSSGTKIGAEVKGGVPIEVHLDLHGRKVINPGEYILTDTIATGL
jgi:hypothetical protein